MAHVHRHGRFILRAARWLPAALVAGLMLWLAHFLATRGPRPVALETAPKRVAMTAEQRTISDELDALETHYRNAEANGELTTEWEARLTRAVSRQNELLRLNRFAGTEQTDRLERLEIARDNLRAEPLIARITSLEEMSREGAGKNERLAQWREALALQIEINRSRAAPRFKDFGRETRLAIHIEAAEAAPLRSEVDAALEAARVAAGHSDWTTTLLQKRKAHQALLEINRMFPRSAQADLRLQSQLGEEIAALEPAAIAAEAEALALGGDTAMAAGRLEAAAEHYESARVRQEELNKKYGRSRFASAQRAEEWEANRQTALAQAAMEKAAMLDEELSRLLLQRRLVAAGRQRDALRAKLGEIAAHYPRGRVPADGLRLKLTLLERHWDEIANLHERCYGMLVPVPGAKNLLMARTKVSQEFYGQIMGTNPSRLLVPTQPVDSVTWADAAEFCRRLSWLLGTVVRLPSDREFLLAAGSPSSDEIGFHDLRGNMVEWLEAGAEAEQAFIAGGNFGQARPGSGEVALNLTPKTTRGRNIGFRFVVEYVLE